MRRIHRGKALALLLAVGGTALAWIAYVMYRHVGNSNVRSNLHVNLLRRSRSRSSACDAPIPKQCLERLEQNASNVSRFECFHECFDQRSLWEADRDAFQRELLDVQKNSAKCVEVPEEHDGVGSALSRQMVTYSTLLVNGYGVRLNVDDDSWALADISLDCETTYASCYLKNIDATGCTRKHEHDGYRARQHTKSVYRLLATDPNATCLEEHWHTVKWGRFLSDITIMDAFLRFSDQFEKKVLRPRLVRLGLESSSCAAVHVRRTDACEWTHRSCFGIDEYADAIAKLPQSISTVYVLTDSRSALEELKVKVTGRSIVSSESNLDVYKRKEGVVLEHLFEKGFGNLDKKYKNGNVFADVLVDMAAAWSCNAFIGALEAGIARVVIAKQTARLGRIPWMVSLARSPLTCREKDSCCAFDPWAGYRCQCGKNELKTVTFMQRGRVIRN